MPRAHPIGHVLCVLVSCGAFASGCYSTRPIVGLPKEEYWVRVARAEGFAFLQPRKDPSEPWIVCRATSAYGRVVHSGTDTLRLVGLHTVAWQGENPGCGNSGEFRVVYADSPDLQVQRHRFRPVVTVVTVAIVGFVGFVGFLYYALSGGST